MKKRFKLDGLDCANCAAKMENLISKIDGVSEISINFLTEKMTIDADDKSFEEIMEKAKKCISKINPDCKIVL